MSALPEPQGPDGFAMARLDPHNRTGTGGVDPLSNNFNWILRLLELKGRGGLDLGLALSLNTLVWTRSGNTMKFDLDDSTIAPGFRLDFPVIEGPYYNDQAGTNFYLLVTPSGARVELRSTGTANTYESADSAHLQLQVIDSTHILVRPTDGTRIMGIFLSTSARRPRRFISRITITAGCLLGTPHNPIPKEWFSSHKMVERRGKDRLKSASNSQFIKSSFWTSKRVGWPEERFGGTTRSLAFYLQLMTVVGLGRKLRRLHAAIQLDLSGSFLAQKGG